MRFSVVWPGPVATAAVAYSHGLEVEVFPELKPAAEEFGARWWGTATQQTAEGCAVYFSRTLFEVDEALRCETLAPVLDLVQVQFGVDLEGREGGAALQELVTNKVGKEWHRGRHPDGHTLSILFGL